MKLPWAKNDPTVPTQRRDPDQAEQRLAEAQTRAERIAQRADRAVTELTERHARNRWTETVQQIARRNA